MDALILTSSSLAFALTSLTAASHRCARHPPAQGPPGDAPIRHSLQNEYNIKTIAIEAISVSQASPFKSMQAKLRRLWLITVLGTTGTTNSTALWSASNFVAVVVADLSRPS
jgi:hypothetical protein